MHETPGAANPSCRAWGTGSQPVQEESSEVAAQEAKRLKNNAKEAVLIRIHYFLKLRGKVYHSWL